MHEMSIAQSIIDVVNGELEERKIRFRVQTVDLKIGRLRAVVRGNLEFCFSVASRGTDLEGAVLRIEEIPVTVSCKRCGHTSTLEGPFFRCGRCGEADLDIVSGMELEIDSIELDEEQGKVMT